MIIINDCDSDSPEYVGDNLECVESGWSIINAAGPIAGLAVTIASVLFAVIILILTIDGSTTKGPYARSFSLRLLLPNLLAMVVSSLLFSLIAGELTYDRASIMAIPAAGLFGISTLGTFVAIAWALKAYMPDREAGAVESGVWVSRLVWVVALAEVGLTMVNAGNHLSTAVLFGIRLWWLVSLLLYVVAAALAWLASMRLGSRRNVRASDQDWEMHVKQASRACLVGFAPVLILYNFAAVRPAGESLKPNLMFYAVVIGTAAYVIVHGVMLLRAVPGVKDQNLGAGSSSNAGSGG